ncbi:MAG: hypothetical protein JWN94_4267 [Betaproteobacteria bacterium]|nr:hypothetical protein [Betaproteobacteria bacterium]
MNAITSPDELAKAWIAYWQHQLETDAYGKADAGFEVDRLAREEPETAWPVILAILRSIDAIPSSRLFQVLAAGPLEDLLSEHGKRFIARIEAEAEHNPKLKLLLGGVWKNEMSEHGWTRVQA